MGLSYLSELLESKEGIMVFALLFPGGLWGCSYSAESIGTLCCLEGTRCCVVLQ